MTTKVSLYKIKSFMFSLLKRIFQKHKKEMRFQFPKKKWKSISISSAKFILDEGKDYLDYTVKESERLTNRAFSLIILLNTVLVTIVGYSFTISASIVTLTPIIIMNISFSVIIVILIILLATVILPRKIMQRGRPPSELIQEYLLLDPSDNDENYLMYIINEIQNTDDNINYNLSTNKSRRCRVKVSIFTVLFLLPAFLFLAFYIAN